MQEVSKDIFYNAIETFEWVSYTQTLAYNLSIVLENTLHWYLDDEKNPQIGCVGYERHKLGLSMLCIKGECLQKEGSIDRKKYAEFYQALHETGFDIYEINLDTHYSEDAEIALRTAGWLRPIGLFSTTLSKIIPTNQAPEYDRRWKRNLQKVHSENLKIEIKAKLNSSDIEDFVTHYQALTLRKGFHDNLNIESLQILSHDPQFKLISIRTLEDRMLAACIFYEHPHAPYPLYLFATPEGRELSATYLLNEQLVSYLATKGITSFDIGRLSPATHKKNNIFLFKDGIGGEYVQYLGEWQWCKSRWMPLALYFMKKYIWKRVQV